jgi:hypothetical protein
MHAAAIVETFDPVDDIELGKRTRVVAQSMRSLTLSVLKKLSIGALTLLCQRVRTDSAKSARINGYSAPDDIALQAPLNFFVRHPFRGTRLDVSARSRIAANSYLGDRPQGIVC